jgi:hypothetical protein
VSTALVAARQEWEEGNRRLDDVRDPVARERLLAQIGVLTDELRRRIGQTFTLVELLDAYGGSERWAREVVSEHAATPGWAINLSTAQAAAFHNYARGAVDYAP